MPTLVVEAPGALSTVQDLGRPGHGRWGVSASGAIDPWALRLANVLVGNEPGAAAVEVTGPGAAFGFRGEVVFVVVGADLGARLDGRHVGCGRAVRAREGQVLKFTARVNGWRAILAVQGGLTCRTFAGSHATDLAAGLPRGRLRRGDMVEIELTPRPVPRLPDTALRWCDDLLADLAPSPAPIRFVPVAAKGSSPLLGRLFTLSDRCNRTGCRLIPDGPLPMRQDEAAASMRSEPVAPGAIQLPPDGQPIVLLADQPTLGGYDVLGHIAAVDRSAAAHLAPGDQMAFAAVEPAHARALARQRRTQLEQLQQALNIARLAQRP